MNQIDLLDPRASDRFLRAYALLASEYAAGAKSAIDSLLPFIKRAVAAQAGNQFNARQISKYVEETYRVRVPIYMMDAFKHKLIELALLEPAHNLAEVLICKADSSATEAPPSLSTNELSTFEQSLTAFAAAKGNNKPYASENWGEALIKFFAGWDEKKPATVARQLILDSKRLDDRVVSGFIASLDKNGANYQIAKKLYYGVLVADFFTCINEVSSKESLKKVDVVLDTTLLMRLLGTSGDLLKDATQELVKDIQQLGGNAFYFSHTYEELIESLEALAHQIGARAEMNRESAHALAAGETSLGKIQLFMREADKRLGQLSITQHDFAYLRRDDKFQIDEEEFAEVVGGARYEEHRTRWARDAQSLALIVRMRAGGRTRKLAESRAIFVTHNGKLARAARDYLDFSLFEVPPILTTDQVSVLAWLERGGSIDDRELSAKLAAACYEAVIPREGWETQFWQQIGDLKQSDEYRELLGSQVLTDAMRSTVLDKSFGEPSLARQLELGPILKELAASTELESRRTREEGIAVGRREAVADFENRARARSIRASKVVTNTLLVIFFFSLCAFYIWPAFRVASAPDDRSIFYWANFIFGTLLGVITVAAIFEFDPKVRRPRAWLENKIAQGIFKLLGPE